MDAADRIWIVLIDFLTYYGLQVLGGILILVVGVRVAVALGSRVTTVAEAREIDATISRFAGNVTKLTIIALVIIFALATLGFTVAPLVAVVGAGAFGITLAVQGPLSNYGAGLIIILTRPYIVGNTIRVSGWFGVVQEVTLAATKLLGEDGELITIPNKRILGEVLVNSEELRMAAVRLYVRQGQDLEAGLAAIRQAVAPLAAGGRVNVGIASFFYGGAVLEVRTPVRSLEFFDSSYAINAAAAQALLDAGIELTAPPLPSTFAAAITQAGDRSPMPAMQEDGNLPGQG